HFDKEDLIQLWTLEKETLSIRQSISDKEKEQWVELKRLFEPDVKDQLWTHTQALMHDPVEWRLYDSCGVHYMLSRDQEIFMLVEKDYPLRKGLEIVMISNKLQGTIDQTLFIRRQRKDFILVQVYVDDIIFGSSNPQLCREFEALMHEKFQMSAMGDILKKFGFSDVRSSNTPMDKENPWGKDGTGKDVELHLYRSMIGSLMYLTTSRPDIIFAVCAYARHQVTPKECHLHAVKRIFRYLKGHPKLGLWYPKASSFDLVAYSDSDYGGASQDRKSTTGGS
nr:hypothetical protein [Tanacetum cinerariifolium]